MTTPTQAQREAALQAVIDLCRVSSDGVTTKAMVDAALTAAAEVELPMQTSEIKVTEGLTAGVGEPKKTEDEFTRIMDARVHATNATIERCALICDGLAKARNRNLGCDPYAREQLRMAARTIRKLKDEA